MTQRQRPTRKSAAPDVAQSFAEWLSSRPAGEMTRLMRTTGLSMPVIIRAKRGTNLALRSAVLLAEHTGLPLSTFTRDVPPSLEVVR